MSPTPGLALSYALDRLFLIPDNTAPTSSVLSFQSATAVANYFGVTSYEARLANEFFLGGVPATMLITRYGAGGARPHLYGANISDLALDQLQSIDGPLSIDFDGYTYSGSINLAGVQSFSAAASAIQSTLNSSAPVAAATTGSSIAPVSVPFTGSVNGFLLQVTSAAPGSIEPGAQISGPGVAAGAQIINQWDGTAGGPGVYVLFNPGGTTSSEAMTESYGLLTVGSVNSGAVADGEQVTGPGVLPLTAIEDNLSGSGAGSTWLVNNLYNNAQTVAPENITMMAPPLSVTYNSVVGATANRDYFEIQPNIYSGFDHNPSSLSYMSGTAAAELGLTQASGALDSTPGGVQTSAAAAMNNIVQNEDSQFGSFQATWTQLAQEDPNYLGDLAAWGQSTDGLYQFLSGSTGTTPAAGMSTPAPDLAGANFNVLDTTTNRPLQTDGAPYSGPVAGLQWEYIDVASDNLNVTANVPNVFIDTGSGENAVAVKSGTNVLNGGTGSNFLTGGSGTDTFFVDDLHASSDIWSTVANFHAGDAATIFGVTQQGFTTSWVDDQGAAGYTGLTLHVTAPGVPTASLTLAGFSTADLSNGQLSTSWGTEADGIPYLYVHDNG
jgi:Protein of unknown function (DUF3383)